ncbi:hypothetical protein V6N11_077352 [Hibiscus sabdariffa]|uniref:Uncharacterized protein n=1 Tax=Hibiscus sabdariffa TaxID=183260 RepID=A0ABR2TCW0_9ROSI
MTPASLRSNVGVMRLRRMFKTSLSLPKHLLKMDCDSPALPRPSISYKDKVLDNSMETLTEDLLPLDDDDIELLDDDFVVGESNGIPLIDFSDHVQSLTLKSMGYTLIIKIFQKVSSKSLGKRGTTSDDKQLTNSLLKVPGNSLVSAQVPSSFDTCSSLMTVPIDVAEHGQVAMID